MGEVPLYRGTAERSFTRVLEHEGVGTLSTGVPRA